MKAELQRQQADTAMLQEPAQLRLGRFLEQNPTIAKKLLELGLENTLSSAIHERPDQSERRTSSLS